MENEEHGLGELSEKAQGSPSPSWKGAHGEWYVVVQMLFFLLVIFGPANIAGLPSWPAFLRPIIAIIGYIFISVGAGFIFSGLYMIRQNITAVPYPKERATLVVVGPFSIVRHPIYCGGIIMALGWALLIHGWLTILYTLTMAIFFDIKSRREEQWLQEKFPAYTAYQKRVRKLIPFIY